MIRIQAVRYIMYLHMMLFNGLTLTLEGPPLLQVNLA